MLARWLCEQGHDARHAADIGLERAADEDIMRVAAEQGMTIVTADLDYPRLLALANTDKPGVVLFRDGDWSEADVVRRMKDVLDALPREDIENSIIVVDHRSIRRRRLPLK